MPSSTSPPGLKRSARCPSTPWTAPTGSIGPVSPRPGQHSPEARACWQGAAEALGWQPGSLREHSDGQLWAWRSAFHREMAWAPPYKGDDLAVVRAEIRRTEIEADRARRNAEAAADPNARQRLADRATALGQWEQMTRDLAERLADAQAGYDAWDRATGPALGLHAERIDKMAGQLHEISERLDEAAMRNAAEARERAAEITSLQFE